MAGNSSGMCSRDLILGTDLTAAVNTSDMGLALLRGPAGCGDGEIHGGHHAEDALDELGPDSLVRTR